LSFSPLGEAVPKHARDLGHGLSHHETHGAQVGAQRGHPVVGLELRLEILPFGFLPVAGVEVEHVVRRVVDSRAVERVGLPALRRGAQDGLAAGAVEPVGAGAVGGLEELEGTLEGHLLGIVKSDRVPGAPVILGHLWLERAVGQEVAAVAVAVPDDARCADGRH